MTLRTRASMESDSSHYPSASPQSFRHRRSGSQVSGSYSVSYGGGNGGYSTPSYPQYGGRDEGVDAEDVDPQVEAQMVSQVGQASAELDKITVQVTH